MNQPKQTFSSKVINTTADALSVPSRAYNAARGAYFDFQRSNAAASNNFKNRSDNTNYYKGTSYWAKNKN